jgi:two-component system, chemotaxis family, CheB/CheR fusion protein
MAFVVILHLDPHHASQMAELLQSTTAMPVDQIARSLTAQPNHVYIIPPDRDLVMADGELRLSARAVGERGRAPIDLFFRSLSETHAADAIGVVLSGTGSDGAQGVRWIKERGGVTMAQAPADAEFDGMPRSAIGTGHVDIVLPARELAVELARFRRAATTIALPAEGEQLGDRETLVLGEVLGHVRSKTGRDFSGYKRPTVLRRLERRMQFAGTAHLAEYLELLRESDTETSTLFNDLLICVTSFFRDPDAFAALEREVVPALFAEKGPEDDVRVWVAGCATGEEAYSLAILLTEYADQLVAPPKIKIFATEVHEKSFAIARDGLYSESTAADVSPARLERFFTHEPGGYRVRKAVREQVLFVTHDLLKDPPFLRLDLASCRNVLIYLQRETQQRVLEILHYALQPGAHLFLGASESPTAASKLFAPVDKKWHIYRSIAGPHPLALRVIPGRGAERRTPSPMTPSRRQQTFSFGAVHQQLVEAYAPPSLVVSADGDVVHLSSEVGRFLSHPGGEPTNKLFDMIGGELRTELRTLLRAAFRTEKPVVARGVRFDAGDRQRSMSVSVHPLAAGDPVGSFALVVFDEQPEARTARSAEGAAESSRAASLEQLEQELAETKARLAATSQEHEATIEEVRAANEELQSITEEQRAVAEELESSQEELQSINEELRTVNQEHRIRNEELAQVNSDLTNLIDSTDIGTVFLDRELQIRRYTPPVTQVFNLVPTDAGRPLSHVTHRLDYPDLASDVRAVLETLERREREVRSDDGRWFTVRLSPYRSVTDKIDGVVLTLINTTDRKHAELDREALLKRVGDASTAKTNFIGVMSHEFRTPLNAILGYAQLLRDGIVGPVTEDQRSMLGRITFNAQHLDHMVMEILTSTQGDLVGAVLGCETVDLALFVRGVADSIEALAESKGLSLTVDVPEPPAMIVTDPMKLHQILVNLLGNAIRYTDHGQLWLRASIIGETVVIEVEDTGIGIAAEHSERVFERFWQVDQSDTRLRGGTGLGLLVVRELARALGGEVLVESEIGRGSLFRVRLPRESSQRNAVA